MHSVLRSRQTGLQGDPAVPPAVRRVRVLLAPSLSPAAPIARLHFLSPGAWGLKATQSPHLRDLYSRTQQGAHSGCQQSLCSWRPWAEAFPGRVQLVEAAPPSAPGLPLSSGAALAAGCLPVPRASDHRVGVSPALRTVESGGASLPGRLS